MSQATVSQVLNGKADQARISQGTSEKVIEAARALGYAPNHAARSLRERRTKLIAFVLPTLENPYFSDVVSAAQEEGRRSGHSLMVLPLRQFDGEFRMSTLLQGAVCDGIVVAGHDHCASPDLPRLAERGLAVVVLQESSRHPSIGSVSVDLENGGYLATRHLITLGHRRIGHLTERLRPTMERTSRLDGYCRALEEEGIAFDPSLVVIAENSMAGGAEGIGRLLAAGVPRPTAAFVYNDQLAVGALHALRGAGLAVPRDFAVVGFDGLAIGGFLEPPLTTVDSPRATLGRIAMKAVTEVLENRALPAASHRLPVHLVVRGSCGGVSATRDVAEP